MTPSMHAYIKQTNKPASAMLSNGPPRGGPCVELDALVYKNEQICRGERGAVSTSACGKTRYLPDVLDVCGRSMQWDAYIGGMRTVRKIRATSHLREVHKLGLFIKTTICSQMYWDAPSYLGELLYHSNGKSNVYTSLFLERSCTYGGKKRGRITIS